MLQQSVSPVGARDILSVVKQKQENISEDLKLRGYCSLSLFDERMRLKQFQAVLFGANVSLDNFQFHANDIAFAYRTVGTPFSQPWNTAAFGS